MTNLSKLFKITKTATKSNKKGSGNKNHPNTEISCERETFLKCIKLFLR